MQKDVTPRMRQRVEALYTYTTALENGDFETIARILHEAEQDAVLEQMIIAMNEVYQREDDAQEEVEKAMEQAAESSLPTAAAGEHDIRLPVRRGRRVSPFFSTLAAVLVVGLLLGSFLVLFASRRGSLGGGEPLSTVNGTWRVVKSPQASSYDHLNGIAALATNDVWVVGTTSGTSIEQSKTLIEHWNGKTWNIVHSPNPGTASNGLTGITSVSANDIWAVGFTSNSSDSNVYTSLLEHWNGTQWSVVANPTITPGTGSQLLQLAAVSTNDVWAVGYSNPTTSGAISSTLIEHWNGKAWSVIPNTLTSHSGRDILGGISARAANDVWAVGSTGDEHAPKDLIEHWNGQSWSLVAGPGDAQHNLESVVALSSKNVWATGLSSSSFSSDGQTLVEHWDGKQWSVVSSPNQGSFDSLSALTVVSVNNIWAVGFSNYTPETLIEHWNGDQWSIIDSPKLGNSVLNDVAAVSANDIWAVGFTNPQGSIAHGLIEHYSK